MDQSKSSDKAITQTAPPKRSFGVEFFVGLFTMVGVAAAGYLAIGLGDVELFGSDRYEVRAEFDDISGLKAGATVEIAGVQVGNVSGISLKDPMAIITLKLNRDIQIRVDDIASIRTKGIIGDRCIKISRGASTNFVPEGGVIKETESAVDIEDIIGKIVHSVTGESDKPKEKVADTSKETVQD